MLEVTNTALDRLTQALDEVGEDRADGTCFRIVPDAQDKLTLMLDTPGSDDTTFDREGATVLVIASTVSDRCDGRKLDVDPTGNLVLS